MREKLKVCVKRHFLISIVIIVSIIVLLVIINQKKHLDFSDNSDLTTQVKEEIKDNNSNEFEEQKVEDNGEKGIDVEENETTTNNTSKTNNSSSSNNNNSVTSEKDNTSNNTDNNLDQNTTYNNSNSNKEEKLEQETFTQQPSEDLTKIANPDDFFYSITGGKVEFSTNAGCMKAGDDISFKDVVDVQYFRCYEVMSKANTIMGYYLNIFCESGNCNSRYKSMINISDYE